MEYRWMSGNIWGTYMGTIDRKQWVAMVFYRWKTTNNFRVETWEVLVLHAFTSPPYRNVMGSSKAKSPAENRYFRTAFSHQQAWKSGEI